MILVYTRDFELSGADSRRTESFLAKLIFRPLQNRVFRLRVRSRFAAR